MNESFTLRRIGPDDNPVVAHIIRTVMTSFGAVGPGYSIMDAEVDNMYESYQERAAYYVVCNPDGAVVGCGGIAALRGGDTNTCELKKMYFLPEARGKGMGSMMLRQLLDDAAQLGYAVMYLETLSSMTAANVLYQKFNFEPLDGPMGHTGHTSCGLFYARPTGTV